MKRLCVKGDTRNDKEHDQKQPKRPKAGIKKNREKKERKGVGMLDSSLSGLFPSICLALLTPQRAEAPNSIALGVHRNTETPDHSKTEILRGVDMTMGMIFYHIHMSVIRYKIVCYILYYTSPYTKRLTKMSASV